MPRSIGRVLVMGCLAVMGSWPAEAKDHPIATSLTKPGSSLQAGTARACAGEDVLGNWKLVRFDSSYRFRNPQAPYLLPHQVFQYSNQGGAKSVHSLYPIGNQATVFEAVPLDMTYHIERRGRVVLKARGHEDPVETWSCEMVTRGHLVAERGRALQRGDLIMTLLGSEGQALFVRHLRRSPS